MVHFVVLCKQIIFNPRIFNPQKLDKHMGKAAKHGVLGSTDAVVKKEIFKENSKDSIMLMYSFSASRCSTDRQKWNRGLRWC